MRSSLPFAAVSALLLASCGGPTPPVAAPSSAASTPVSAPPASAKPAPETIATDTPRTTTGGTTFTAPAGWSLSIDGPAAHLTAPEGNLRISVVDTGASSADDAVKAAWATLVPDFKRALRVATPGPGRDGWSEKRVYEYETSPDEKREVFARALRHGATWTVMLIDGDVGTFEKRIAHYVLLRDTTRPKGFVKESFTGKKAHTLDAARLKQLTDFVDHARALAGVPGVGLTLVQGGAVVFSGGFGVRELGKAANVDADTLFMIASNTKALTTLLLAEQVDDGKFTWETKVTAVYPGFKLGDAATTDRVLMKHLVCACTGLPRQDYEWLYEFRAASPKSELDLLATFQPTSKFGEVYQYSNLMAAAAGFVGAHVADPKKELGKAYDEAMQARVFGPLGMTHTTLDFALAQKGNHATPHADDVDGKPSVDVMSMNYAVVPLRPAGGAWSSSRDLAKYVEMELDRGVVPGGRRLVSERNLLARRERQVNIGEHSFYGMGLVSDTEWGVTVVHHGGGMAGFISDMFWLPEYGVGGVLLTNSDNGAILRKPVIRRLLEVLFDGNAEAEDDVAASVAAHKANEVAMRKRLQVPADPAVVAKLAMHYRNKVLGDLEIRSEGGQAVLDAGEWKSVFATKKNDDGSVSLLAITPGINDFEHVVVDKGGKRSLVVRDGQHEYVFGEVGP